MASQTKCQAEGLLELKEIIAKSDYHRCKDFNERHKEAYLSNLSVVKYCDLFQIDDLASSLMPDDVDNNLVPIKTLGDGNCLYNSASLCITGDESLSTTLRLLVAAELFLNSNYYSNHPHLIRTIEDPKLFTDHYDTLFSMILSDESSFEYDCNRDRKLSIKKEALLTCQDGKWSSLVHILALSSVLGVPIRSVYPDVNEGIRSMFHAEILPRDASQGLKKLCVNIMWSRDGNLDSMPGVSFQPNHFVGLLALNNDNTNSNNSANEATQHERSGPESTVCDIGDVINDNNANALSNDQKVMYLKNHFKPEANYKHFITNCIQRGKQKKQKTLTFQHSWLQKYKWLVYSPSLKGGFCKYCTLFSPKDARIVKLGTFVTKSFQNLGKATGNDGLLETHSRLQYHLDAMAEASTMMQSIAKPETTMPYHISKKNQDLYEQNVEILKCIVQTVALCGQQNIALRGHRDDNTSLSYNKGNFRAILELQALSNEILRHHLDSGPKNAQYTSKTVQNEIINIMADYVRRTVVKSLEEENAVYSIIADEVTDKFSNQEVLSVCLRFVDYTNNPEIKEAFFDFINLERTTGEMIANAILQSLKERQIDISNARGQAYDGAAAMSSDRVGVQAHIKQHQPLALYTHCKSHVLNLCIASSCQLPYIRNMIGSLNETYLFFAFSPKRQRFFERVLEIFGCDSNVKKLKGLCKTRWVERHTCYETFYELFTFVCLSLEAILDPDTYENVYTKDDVVENWSWDRDTRVKCQGLVKCLKSTEFIVAFLVAKNFLEMVKPLASKLQKRDQDVFQAYTMIDKVIKDINETRQNIDQEFKEVFDDVERLSEKLGSDINVPRIASRQAHRPNIESNSPQEYYKRSVAIPFLDHLIEQMNSRFNKTDRVGGMLFGLIPSNIIALRLEELGKLKDYLFFWESDLETPSSLLTELKRWKRKWSIDTADAPNDFMNCLKQADEDEYPNLRQLFKIGAVLPISSSEAERSFSVLRRSKTYLRNTMGQERLTGLALLNIHRNIEIDMDVICKAYIERHSRRMFRSCLLYQD